MNRIINLKGVEQRTMEGELITNATKIEGQSKPVAVRLEPTNLKNLKLD